MNRRFLRSPRLLLVMVLLAVVAGVATAVWAFGSTAYAQTEPTIVISPSSGPCDATVQVSGSGFEPGATVPLDLARPYSEGSMARLGAATASPQGEFHVDVTLGQIGCEAAALAERVLDPPDPNRLTIYAGHDPARRFVLTRAVYTYTTTSPSPVDLPVAAPATGGGGTSSGSQVMRVVPLLALACGSLLVVVAALASRRRFLSERRARRANRGS